MSKEGGVGLFILKMIKNGEKGDEIELKLMNPPVPKETANRATANDQEAIGDVEDDVVGKDITRTKRDAWTVQERLALGVLRMFLLEERG